VASGLSREEMIPDLGAARSQHSHKQPGA